MDDKHIRIKKIARHALDFIPGFVILALSMYALYSSVVLLRLHEVLEASYNFHYMTHQSESGHHHTDGTFERIQNALSSIHAQERWLYWSILGMGLAGFVLVVLNTDKLKKLRKSNEDRKKSIALLEGRQKALGATFDGICIVDNKGAIQYMNPAFRDMFALGVIGHPDTSPVTWRDLFTPDSSESLWAEVEPALQKLGYWHGDITLKRHDGQVIQGEYSLTALEDGGMVGTVRDMAERNKSRREHEALQEQLFQAQKMEAVGRLAGGIAHDFNNILAAMNGYAEFLSEDLKADSKEHKYAVNILTAGRQAKGLVDQMLTFSRHKGSERERFDVAANLREAHAMLEASLPKTIDMSVEYKAEGTYVYGNSPQISQLIMNLCVNAKDAMESEHGALSMVLDIKSADDFSGFVPVADALPEMEATPQVHSEDLADGATRVVLNHLQQGRRYISLSVQDTGCGMGRSVLDHVFEPFFTTKPVHKGTGLGLSTVHGVIVSHQGVLILTSKIGEGTTFELLFPMDDAAGLTGVAPANDRLANYATSVDWANLTVMVVDDQEEVRDVTMTMLERMGVMAVDTDNGHDALSAIRESPGAYDLIITDYNMPKMTGAELAKQALEVEPYLPFLLMSGYSEKKLTDILDANPNIHRALRKPVTSKDLYRKIAEVFEVAKAA